jgi:capsular polysaccharide biosynthesis protein
MGMMFLWLRVLADWAKTLIVEHLSNLNERKFSVMRTLRSLTADPRLRAPFFRVFVAVVIPAIICSMLITICSPRIYSSTAQIEVQNPNDASPPSISTDSAKNALDPYFMPTQLKIIRSYYVLTNVIGHLNLTKILPEQLGEPRWTMDETYKRLSETIDVKQNRATSLIEVSFKNPSPQLAARIVNEIAFWYKEARLIEWRQWRDNQPSPGSVTLDRGLAIVRDPGRAELHPISPNRRIFLMWLLGGTLLALFAGGIAAWFQKISHPSLSSEGERSAISLDNSDEAR